MQRKVCGYMHCPFCDSSDLKVIDSRASDDKKSIRRRRECNTCRKRFTTHERIEEIPIMVIKKNNLIEEFDRNKILNGVVKACWKRPISVSDMEKLVDEVESEIVDTGKAEIDTNFIGGIVMQKLKLLDEVTYVRFASVYKEFKDIESFMQAIKSL